MNNNTTTTTTGAKNELITVIVKTPQGKHCSERVAVPAEWTYTDTTGFEPVISIKPEFESLARGIKE